MAVQQHRGGNPWDFADDIGSAVDTALEMHYRDKKDARDEEKYNDNKMLTMFQMEEQSLQQSYQNSMKMLEFVKDPDLQMDYLMGPEWGQLTSDMDGLRDRRAQYFRRQGMNEEEVIAKNRHLNLNPYSDTFKKTLAPRKALKDIYNQYYNPLSLSSDDLTKQGYNENTIHALAQQWKTANPDGDYMDFFEQPKIQEWLDNEEKAYTQFNSIVVDKEYRDRLQGSVDKGHGRATNMQKVWEHGDTVGVYLSKLQETQIIPPELADKYRGMLSDSALSGDIEQYKRALENINIDVKKQALFQQQYNTLYTFESQYHDQLVELAQLEDPNDGISTGTLTDIAESAKRMDEIATKYNLIHPGVATANRGGAPGGGVPGGAPGGSPGGAPLTLNEKLDATNTQLGADYTAGLKAWNTTQAIPKIAHAMSSLMANNQGLFNDTSFSPSQADALRKGNRVVLDGPNGQWKVQINSRTPNQLAVWGPNKSKGFMFNLEHGGWQDASTVKQTLEDWDQMGVAGLSPGDILSGPLKLGTGRGKVKPDAIPYIQYMGPVGRDGYHEFRGINRKGEPVNYKGQVVKNPNEQWKWTNKTLGGGPLTTQGTRHKALNKALMSPGIKSHGSMNYFDEEGSGLIIQDDMIGSGSNLPTTTDTNPADYSAGEVEVE